MNDCKCHDCVQFGLSKHPRTQTCYIVVYKVNEKFYLSSIHGGEALLSQTTFNALEFYSYNTAMDYMSDLIKNGFYEEGEIRVEEQ